MATDGYHMATDGYHMGTDGYRGDNWECTSAVVGYHGYMFGGNLIQR